MPIFRAPALAIAAVLALPSAGASPAPPPDSTLSMNEHQSITIAPGAVLTYDSVNDSRCPPGVQCVVAGKIVYSFTLVLDNRREQFTLTPAAPVYTSAALQGKQITLADTAPPSQISTVSILIVTP